VRDELCRQLVVRSKNARMVFLTGDLGFMALEPLQEAMGERFVNCGVAEQNMVTVAAAMSYEGLEAWTYTIAPFCYARALEQIRNDVCFHRLPVKLLANGGGYGYGVMGPTHHALEDYGILSTLPGMRVFVPAFDQDVEPTIAAVGDVTAPAYVRLGRGELPENETAPAYAPWRLLLDGHRGVMVAVGPLAGTAWRALRELTPNARPSLWAVTELPIGTNPPPPLVVESLMRTPRLAVAEEHVAQGGVGQQLCYWAVENGIRLDRFRHLTALGYPGGTYGSQAFHRKASHLDPQGMADAALMLSL
jgi:transketolase